LHFSRENVCKQFAVIRQIAMVPTGTMPARAEPEIPPETPLLAPTKTDPSNTQPEASYLFLEPIRLPATGNCPSQTALVRATQGWALGDATSAAPPALPVPVVILPSWASPSSNAVVARTSQTRVFDTEGSYWVKPDFLRVLRAVEGVHPTKLVFRYREVTIPHARAGRRH
jgi:hypothetical protein